MIPAEMIAEYEKEIEVLEKRIADLKSKRQPADNIRIYHLECMLGDLRYSAGMMKRGDDGG